jgi:hypothetical protein
MAMTTMSGNRRESAAHPNRTNQFALLGLDTR